MAHMGEHRVPMLGSRRFEDPAHSADPKIRAIVSGLQTLDVVPPARAHFRAELRAQLVAVAPRLVAEGVGAETSVVAPAPVAAATVSAPEARTAPERRRSRLSLGRPFALVTACLALLGLILGGATVLSRHALPGDALYGLKRAGENLQLATASSPADKAADLLGFASQRADEVLALLADDNASAADPSSISTDTAKLVTSTLGDADSELRQASRAMSSAAVRQHSGAPLAGLLSWSPGQLDRLQDVLGRIPAGSLHARAAESQRLVLQARSQARALRAVAACADPTTDRSNALGPIPVARCTTRPSTPPKVTRPAPTTGTTRPRTTHSRSVGTVAPPAGSPSGSGRGSSSAPAPQGSTSGSATLPVTVPTLPVTLPSLPTLLPSVAPPSVTAGSCGLSASVPGLGGVTVGTCGISLHPGH
jgi:hypothetical protein